MFDPFDNSDPWNPAWTTNIGTPAATKQQVGSGWMRLYTGGAALVNPNPTISQKAAANHFDGGFFLGSRAGTALNHLCDQSAHILLGEAGRNPIVGAATYGLAI